MDNKLLLAKAITLLYRESQLTVRADSSAELVRTLLDSIKVADIGIGIGTENDVIVALKATVLEMCTYPQDHVYDITDLLQRIRVNTSGDEKLYLAIEQGIKDDLSESSLKRSITNMRKQLMNHFKHQEIGNVLNKYSADYKFGFDKIKNIDEFVREMIAQLEPLSVTTSAKDPAIIDEVDVGDMNSLNRIIGQVESSATNDRVYKTGWQGLNRMLQGGFRGAESWVFGGLQHKYKSGFHQSIFNQIARYNKPYTTDPNKKPLLLMVSFEDTNVKRTQFAIQQIAYTETRAPVLIRDLGIDQMRGLLQEKLQVNGFHVRFLHVDGTLWGYRDLCHKIIEYEAQGYVIEALFVDYLYKMSTVGCLQNGMAGSDFLDMFTRIRNFCIPRGILFCTPHQLSTECKVLLRGAVTEDKLVKELVGKGYYEGSKRLDQVPDGIILIHLFTHNGKTYLAMQRDRHRIPTIVDEEDKYCLYEFPKKMPIPDDIQSEDASLKRLMSASSNTKEELFQFST